MSAEDLARWDISIINQNLMKPESYREFETEVLLKNGLGARYGLGVMVRSEFGHRELSHDGEVSGFTSDNLVFPDERVAVVVLTNQDAAAASEAIATGIAPLLLASDDPRLRKNLHKHGRSSTVYNTARLTVRFSPTMPISISMSRR